MMPQNEHRHDRHPEHRVHQGWFKATQDSADFEGTLVGAQA